MEDVITFSTKLSKPDTRSVIVYENQNTLPIAVYSYDLLQFEYVRLKDEKVISALGTDDMKDSDNIQLQYIHHFFLDKKIHFLIATRTLYGLESCLYLFEPVQSTLRKITLNKKLTGKITNMFISKQSEQEKEYYILTVGTLDSALYVIRFTKSELESKEKGKIFKCALLRTDARSATAQEIIVLKSKPESPSDRLIVCGGANGTIDFFLMKGDHDVTAEVSVEFQPHDTIELPSKCPIISLQQLKDSLENEDGFVLAVGQQLLHPSRISRLLEPSMTIIKMKTKGLLCTDTISKKFSIGTYILPVENNMVWSCLPDSKETQVTKTTIDIANFQFGDTSNVFTTSLITPGDKVQHIHVDVKNCWILSTGKLAKGTLKEKRSKKRRHED